MANYIITAPDGTKYKVTAPDNASHDDVLKYVQSQHVPAPQSPLDTAKGYGSAFATGVAKGGAAMAGLPGDIREGSRWLGNKAYPGAGDVAANVLSSVPFLGQGATSTDINHLISAPFGGYHQASGTGEQIAESAGSFLPAAFGGEAGLLNRALRVAGPAVGSVFGGDTAKAVGLPEGVGQVAGAVGGGVATLPSTLKSVGRMFTSVAVPTVKALKDAARAAYQTVDNSGMVIKQTAVKDMADALDAKLAARGIHPTLHPDAMAARGQIQAASANNQTLQGLDVLRRVASDAALATKPADKMMGRIIRDHLDDFVENLGPSDVAGPVDQNALSALSDARDLWSRAAKGEQIGRLIEKAQIAAPNFSGSGYENALRTQFRRLAMNDRGIARFTPEEQDAIKRVAQGGPIENALRLLGKFAPSGIVSGALSAGAGYGAGGIPGAIALPLAGGLARSGATALTSRNARLAAELMRRGPAPPVAPTAAGLDPRALGRLLVSPYIAGNEAAQP